MYSHKLNVPSKQISMFSLNKFSDFEENITWLLSKKINIFRQNLICICRDELILSAELSFFA